MKFRTKIRNLLSHSTNVRYKEPTDFAPRAKLEAAIAALQLSTNAKKEILDNVNEIKLLSKQSCAFQLDKANNALAKLELKLQARTGYEKYDQEKKHAPNLSFSHSMSMGSVVMGIIASIATACSASFTGLFFFGMAIATYGSMLIDKRELKRKYRKERAAYKQFKLPIKLIKSDIENRKARGLHLNTANPHGAPTAIDEFELHAPVPSVPNN